MNPNSRSLCERYGFMEQEAPPFPSCLLADRALRAEDVPLARLVLIEETREGCMHALRGNGEEAGSSMSFHFVHGGKDGTQELGVAKVECVCGRYIFWDEGEKEIRGVVMPDGKLKFFPPIMERCLTPTHLSIGAETWSRSVPRQSEHKTALRVWLWQKDGYGVSAFPHPPAIDTGGKETDDMSP